VSLDAARLSGLLETERIGRSLRVLEQTGSTNDDARADADADAGSTDGHVVIADAQRAGRGSHGRPWSSPAGADIYLSILLRPGLPPEDLAPLTLAVGLGVAEAVESHLPGRTVALKWPNDVLVGARKCAGILVESQTLGGRVGAAIVGIGVNVNRERFPEELTDIATSLRLELGVAIDRERVTADLLLSVERWVDRLVAMGPAPIVNALEGRLAMRGERVACGDVTGELLGVGPSGALRIATAEGVREVRSGTLVAAGG